jgi:hypothetical protein
VLHDVTNVTVGVSAALQSASPARTAADATDAVTATTATARSIALARIVDVEFEYDDLTVQATNKQM